MSDWIAVVREGCCYSEALRTYEKHGDAVFVLAFASQVSPLKSKRVQLENENKTNDPMNANKASAMGSQRSRWVYMTPSNTGEPRGFVEALGPTVQDSQVPADFDREHHGALSL